MKNALKLSLLVLAVALTIAPSDLESCGPFFRNAVFTLKRRTALPETTYGKGQLGVVLPSFDRKNLVVAYRYWTGVPITPEEADAFYPKEKPQTAATTGLDQWMKARNLTSLDTDREIRAPGNYSSFTNCLDDAFRTAAATLEQRTKTWGAASANLKEWIAGQDQVFSNCSGPTSIPDPTSGKAPLLVADRQYQIAAAAFYAGDWELARKSFDRVVANPASPWRSKVPYLRARVSIREATVGGNKDAFARAERELAEAKNTDLIGFVQAQAHPLDRLAQLSNSFLKPQPGPKAEQAMTDFILLYDKLSDGQIGKAAEVASRSELADWIETFQGKVHPHALEKWRATHTVPWLAAALATANPGDAEDKELIDAADAVPPGSPAQDTLNYFAGKLQDPDAARQRIDRELQRNLPLSSRNLFLSQRMKLARDWAEFLKFAPKLPSGQDWGDAEEETDWKNGAVFDDDSVLIFNRSAPLSRWIEAAKAPSLTPYVRNELLAPAWTRAILLGKTAEAHELATLLQRQRPELAPAMKAYLAADARSAQFTAIYWILRTPGMSPWLRSGFGRDPKIVELSEFRDNWWSKPEDNDPPDAPFLTEADRKLGKAESSKLPSNGATYLAAETVKYLQADPTDPRGAEALALAVRATHFSTTDEKTGSYSKQAFDLLHRNFPNTTFAKETKYWYK